MTEQASAPAPTPDASLTPEQARTTLDAFKADRLANKVTDTEWNERSGFLMERAAGNMDAKPADAAPKTMDERLEADVSEMMEGAPPEAYNFHSAANRTDAESLALDSTLRHAFSEAAVPQHLGDAIYSEFQETAAKFADAKPEAILARIDDTKAALARHWGDDFDKRIEAIDTFLESMVDDKHPELGFLLEDAPHVIAANGVLLNALDRIAQHQAKGKL